MTLTAGMMASPAFAQQSTDNANLDLTNGFDSKIDSVASLQEILRQDNLYVMEVTFKPMRMRWVDRTDPKTGKKTRELVWYLVYKCVNRPVPKRPDASNTTPVNNLDPVPPPLFVPEFLLVTSDNGKQETYHDTIDPVAQADIQLRENHYKGQPKLRNTVEITGAVPPVTPEPMAAPAGTPAKAAPDNAIFGVAIFRNVDPETDFFTVYMSGFSNGYRKANGIVEKKTIVQKFLRPGDRFFENEAEIKRDGDPSWAYWPEDTAAKPATKKP